ncbi:hypothetical protein [Candidatus Symbiobacter mobilis]|uniref:Uncharacterized protein n=1 Tax=Candidatus Symbiobacter mobilis CR TaxID=946483 RepID=U5N7L2_9BURK|nr:hypothetical protein [Candidatus Symbiobacter mobilis]AGX87305.1 hypothetical protein Cenrod_1213 [Candidatus Symbiobacter mobilis CR]
MTDPQHPQETDVPLFDVFVEVPPNTSLESIRKEPLLQAGLQLQQVEALFNTLRSTHRAKVGAAVTRERSHAASKKFAGTGLKVSISPVLALESLNTGAIDTRFLCPACEKRVVLPDNRQCPECGVFVDKVDEEFLLKRKILQQERAKLEMQAARETQEAAETTRKALEDAMRARIREELEAEYGIRREREGIFHGKAGLLRVAGLVTLMAASFVGGQTFTSGKLPWESGDAVSSSAANVDKMLDKGLGAAPSGGSMGDSAATMAAGGASSTTGDPDIDNDPMMQAIGGNRVGAKGLSLEQALGAATVLAKAVGNTTAERAWGGGAPGAGVGAIPGATPGIGGEGAGGAELPTVPVSARIKLVMQSEFAQTLAELGHRARALAVIRSIRANPALANEPRFVEELAVIDIDIQARSLQAQSNPGRKAIDDLRARIEALPYLPQRVRSLGRVAVILAQHPGMSQEVPHAFLSMAGASLKTVNDDTERSTLMGEWMTAMAQVLQTEAQTHARSGHWNKVQAHANTLQTMQNDAPDRPTARMAVLAVRSSLAQWMGQDAPAREHLQAAIDLAATLPSFAERAAALRTVARLAGPHAWPDIQAAIQSLLPQIDPAVGPDKAAALTQLALLHAEQGAQEPSLQMAQRAEAATGMTPPEMREIKTDLSVRRTLALARAQHQAKAYAQSESLLQQVSDYLY